MKNLSKNIKICAYCGKEFTAQVETRKYCCRYCSRKGRSKVQKRPVAKTLQKLMLTHSIADIGRIYGVSGNAVRKWCKRYNIEYNHSYVKEQREKKKAQEKKIKKSYHLNYLEAPVQMKGYYKHNQNFKNIYEAADYVKRNRWTKSPTDIVIASIKRVILGERNTYLGCTWESLIFVQEHNNSIRCKEIEEKKIWEDRQ